jgi:hypothetical protein
MVVVVPYRLTAVGEAAAETPAAAKASGHQWDGNVGRGAGGRRVGRRGWFKSGQAAGDLQTGFESGCVQQGTTDDAGGGGVVIHGASPVEGGGNQQPGCQAGAAAGCLARRSEWKRAWSSSRPGLSNPTPQKRRGLLHKRRTLAGWTGRPALERGL